MSDPTTSEATPKSISSPASADGASQPASPDGPTTSHSGPEAAPASRSRRRGSAKASKTSVTSGLSLPPSSASAGPLSWLENRLRARMGSAGLMEYALTWKLRTTPGGRAITALRASTRRTSDSGFGGWPTPMAGTPAQNGNNPAGNTDSSRRTVALVQGWRTPTKGNGDRGGQDPERREGHTLNLQDEVMLASGPATNSSPAETAPRGALNPAFSRWLMGYPAAWDACAPTGTRSSRKSAPKSSAPISTDPFE